MESNVNQILRFKDEVLTQCVNKSATKTLGKDFSKTICCLNNLQVPSFHDTIQFIHSIASFYTKYTLKEDMEKSAYSTKAIFSDLLYC